jgi:hypothetical protein
MVDQRDTYASFSEQSRAILCKAGVLEPAIISGKNLGPGPDKISALSMNFGPNLLNPRECTWCGRGTHLLGLNSALALS